MKLRNILFIAASITFHSNAAIIDNEHNLPNSFKDTETGLVWLDFGVNNNKSYDYVASQLGLGGVYYGWRLPSVKEVYMMWSNLADLDGISADLEEPNLFGRGQLYALSNNTDAPGGDDSVWEDVFDFIGYNQIHDYPGAFSNKNAIGLFKGYSEGLARVSFSDYTDKAIGGFFLADVISLQDDQQYNLSYSHSGYSWSTLLVRAEVIHVPEPETITILVLAILGLSATRHRISKG